MKYQDEEKLHNFKKVDEIISSLPEYTRVFFEAMENKNMSERSVVQYAYDISRFYGWLNGRDINELSIEDVNEYLRTLYYSENSDPADVKMTSPAFRARKASSLRSYLKYMHRIGYLKQGLAELIDLPKVPEKHIVTLDENDIARLLDVCKNKRDYTVTLLFLATGIRVSELVGLDIKDCDLENDSIIVRRKGGNEAEVYFGQQLHSALLEYLTARKTVVCDCPALFLSNRNQRMAVRTVQYMIKHNAELANVNTKATPHAFRRSFATSLYDKSNDIYLVSEALGHSSVETTRKHYAKQDAKRMKEKLSHYSDDIIKG